VIVATLLFLFQRGIATLTSQGNSGKPRAGNSERSSTGRSSKPRFLLKGVGTASSDSTEPIELDVMS